MIPHLRAQASSRRRADRRGRRQRRCRASAGISAASFAHPV